MNNQQNITISKAASEIDFANAAALFEDYQQELGVDLCFQGFQEELQSLPAMYGPPGGCILIAYVDGIAAGCVAVRPKGAGTCEMKRLYVAPAARKSGLGKMLAEAIIRQAMELGYNKMVLDTLDTLQPAIHLYTKLGFTECEPYYHNPLQGVVYMERNLS